MFVAIEGIDGAGKGTLTASLKARGEAAGVSVATLSFPRYEETSFSRLIAQYLNGEYGALDDVPARFAALLYAGDRFESRTVLAEMIAGHDLLICDRYVASNMAYQAARLKPSERAGFLDWLDATEHGVFGLPRPERTLWLTTDTATADALVARKGARSYTAETRDLHEADSGLLERVAGVYAELAAADPVHWRPVRALDAEGTLRPPDAIAEDAWAELKPLL